MTLTAVLAISHGRVLNTLLVAGIVASVIRLAGFALSPLQIVNFDQAADFLLDRLNPLNVVSVAGRIGHAAYAALLTVVVSTGFAAYLELRATSLQLFATGYGRIEEIVSGVICGVLVGLFAPLLLRFCVAEAALPAVVVKTLAVTLAGAAAGYCMYRWLPTNWQDPVNIVPYVAGISGYVFVVMAGATSALVVLMLLSAIASLVVASIKVTFSGLATARWSTTMLVFIATGALGYARYVLLP